ncbi:hypothetical protein DPMN_076764 [Dreissena polymorpha]|uniref:Uncharacterized protein n=1 Tax=Dreissena polymorpha TaxID=45954 RepID=A0A9D3YMT3_DREPO|nr:hypothetical protein DPMN_076764 [Dreissena polymorpha]
MQHIIGYMNHELALNEFLFIASEGWGLSINMTQYRKLLGTITVATRLWTTDGFVSHLKALRPENKENPWIRPYLEMIYNSYFESSIDKSVKMKCN